MFRQLRAVHARYLVSHLMIDGGSTPIRDAEGNQIGHVDRVTIAQGRLHVSGWVTGAARVTLVQSGAEVAMVPRLHRADVGRRLGIPADVGFDLALPCSPQMLAESDPPGLIFAAAGGRDALPALSLALPRLGPIRWRLHLRFFKALLITSPDAIRWLLRRDPGPRARITAALGLSRAQVEGPLETRLFLTDKDDPVRPAPVRITILLPVYNAFDLLADVLARVAAHTDLPWRLIVIEDASPDARVRPFLREWAARQAGAAQQAGVADTGSVTLIENPRNLGFIGAVNVGLAAALAPDAPPPPDGIAEGPVVLLNSDAFVPAGWASRLVRPMLLHDNIASVTPMSNDAEIFSVPAICQRTDLAPGQGDAIDALAARFHPDALLSVAPTGVGFCMALGRDWLRRVPQLDPVFGRGYGEEVDWCQKVRALGGRHLGLPGLFVEHRGGASFGSAEKLAMVAANNAIVSERYPGYDVEVQDFIASDPLLTARLALGLGWAGSRPGSQPGDPDVAVPVYLVHNLGGGAEIYLQQRIARDLGAENVTGGAATGAGAGVAVVLRVGGTRRWQIELHSPGGRTSGATDDTDLVLRLLDALPRRQVVYSCAVGDPDPLALPALLAGLKRGPGDRIEVLFHDFFPVSPSYNLLDSDGVFRGPMTRDRADPAHQTVTADGTAVSLADWQDAWGRLIAAADELRVFSASSADLIAAVWPDHADRIVQRPHTLPYLPPRLPAPPPQKPPVLGVLGGINYAKGAAVLVDLVDLLDGSATAARLVVIGKIDPDYELPAPARVHGAYVPQDIPALAAHYGISHWLIPSVWPETFSYATHEALATGLPVLAFDIGAQGAAVRAAANGIAVALPPTGDSSRAAALLAALHKLTARQRRKKPASPRHRKSTGTPR